jgi:hypothetical protein
LGDILVRKGLTIGIIVLFTCVAVTPTIGISNFIDDTTPPITNISFDPPEPDGLNGWYISNVTVTLNATDDISGVKEIHYRIAEGEWKVHTGDFVVFILDQDCLIGSIEFYSIDNAGNQEELKSVLIKIDQLQPNRVTWELHGNPNDGWWLSIKINATASCIPIQRIDIYLNGELEETIVGPGPFYGWDIQLSFNTIFRVKGIIRNVKITDEYVNLSTIAVRVSHLSGIIFYFKIAVYDYTGVVWYELPILPPFDPKPGIYLFKNLTFLNKYKGYIGKFLIFATFEY